MKTSIIWALVLGVVIVGGGVAYAVHLEQSKHEAMMKESHTMPTSTDSMMKEGTSTTSAGAMMMNDRDATMASSSMHTDGKKMMAQ